MFHEGLCRRLAMVLWTMYVDDGQITDLQEAMCTGQELVHVCFEACGADLAAAKRRWMALQGDFLGVVHDFTKLPTLGEVEFEPRPELVTKLQTMLHDFTTDNRLTPAEASKFQGTQGFMNTAMFGQLSKAGVRPFIDRQYRHVAPWTLSHTLQRACEFYNAIMKYPPRRVLPIRRVDRPPLVIASDAQVEPGQLPGAGYIIWDAESNDLWGAYYRHHPRELKKLNTSMEDIAAGKQPIARCECAALPTAVFHEHARLRDRDVLWFVDNTAALAGVVKGTSGEPINERLIGQFWMAVSQIGARIWVEYLDSKGNWSDGISREFDQDEFVREKRVRVRELQDPLWWMCDDVDTAWERSKSLIAHSATA